MQELMCGDVVAGCEEKLSAVTRDQLVRAFKVHARREHGFEDLPSGVLELVILHIRRDAA